MQSSSDLAQSFQDLHVKGKPVILYNVWDAGSAITVAGCGAQAIASGSHGVANANGYEDGEKTPFDLAIQTSKRIVEVTDLPVTMDIETGYGANVDQVKETARKVIDSGVVGINIEDMDFETGNLRPIDEQVERLKAIRQVADEANFPLHINARTDTFKNADPSEHNQELLQSALERARAFANAGANSFFIPGLKDIDLIRKLCENSPIPVNIIQLGDMPSNQELADAGVARISYGPVPYLEMIEWLKDKAKQTLSSIN